MIASFLLLLCSGRVGKLGIAAIIAQNLYLVKTGREIEFDV